MPRKPVENIALTGFMAVGKSAPWAESWLGGSDGVLSISTESSKRPKE